MTNKTSATINTFFLIILLILYAFLPYQYDNDLELTILGITIASTIVFFISNDIRRSLNLAFRPIILFIISFHIVFFQFYYDLVLGIKDISNISFLSPELINKCTILSSIGLCVFYIGASLTEYKCVQSTRTHNTTKQIDTQPYKIIFIFSTILWLIYNVEICLSGAYSQEMLEQSAGTLVNYSNILFTVASITLISTITYNLHNIRCNSIYEYLKPFGVVPLLCILIYVLLTLNLGDRGPIITILCSLFGGYVISAKQRISLVKFIIIIVIAASISSTIGMARRVAGNSMIDKMQMIEADPSETCIPITAELASSQKTLQYAVDNVPSKHDYLYGSFQLRNILSTIPFSSRITSSFLDSHWKYQSSDFFITYLIQGNFYTYGNGTSLIADLYLSFGLIGIIIGMLFLGVVIKKIERKVFLDPNASIYNIVLYISFCGYAIIEARSGLLSPINYIVFSIILTYIIQIINKQ